MKYLRNLVNRIPPKTIVYAFYFLAAWLVFTSIGQLWAVWPELFSGEEVINIW